MQQLAKDHKQDKKNTKPTIYPERNVSQDDISPCLHLFQIFLFGCAASFQSFIFIISAELL